MWARKFARTDTRRRRVGVFGRACRGERESGDDAAFVRTATALVAGSWTASGTASQPARHPNERGTSSLAQPELDPAVLLLRCDAALAHTRGAVMTVARIDEARGGIALASVGNVGAAASSDRQASRRFGGSSFVLGSPGGARRVPPRRAASRRATSSFSSRTA